MKRRICFLMDTIFSYGGVQRVTAVIAKELAKDSDVTIVTLDKSDNMDLSFYELHDSDIHYRFFAYPKTIYWKLKICKAYSYLYRKMLPQNSLTSDWYAHSSFPSEKRDALAHELLMGEYDVIVGVHAPLAVRLASCRGKLKGIRLIGWIHNSYKALFGEGSTYIGPELRKHYEFQLAKLDKTIVLCKNDAKQYHFPTQVIYNPLTLKPGAPSKGQSKTFLAVGRFSYLHKGFDLLIKAFHIFAQRDDKWILDIVGEGPEEQKYRQIIKERGLQGRVRIHPFTNDIQSYYSAAQVYVLSSRWEGMPLVLMEAMSHGLPIITSDLPVCQEILGDFGLFFENGNIEQLAERLYDATQIDWTDKSAKALQKAAQFEVGNIINQWKEIL